MPPAFIKLLRTETQTTDSTRTRVNSSWLAVAVGRVLVFLNSPASAVGKVMGLPANACPWWGWVSYSLVHSIMKGNIIIM